MGRNKELEKYVGHIEHDENGRIQFPDKSLRLVKTHRYPLDMNPAIYIVRDGRKTCVSMWYYYKQEISLETIILGELIFGTWSAHLQAWQPWERPNTLLLKYEDLVGELPKVLEILSRFLQKEIVAHQIPPRESIADVAGKWVRSKRESRDLPEEYLGLFNLVNGAMMEKLGYYP